MANPLDAAREVLRLHAESNPDWFSIAERGVALARALLDASAPASLPEAVLDVLREAVAHGDPELARRAEAALAGPTPASGARVLASKRAALIHVDGDHATAEFDNGDMIDAEPWPGATVGQRVKITVTADDGGEG